MSAGAVAAMEDTRKTVLVVDDAPSNIRVVNEILHKTYKVRVATNGEKALELAKATPGPDLILLDVVMPGIDGYEVCTRLKADGVTKDIPVIFLTGQTEIEDETRGFETGAVDYIHKPFSPAVVAARVQTHLALRETRQRLARQLKDLRSELDNAHKIQMSILPRDLPKIDRLDIAARYIPASAVAGDFYDFFLLDEKRVGVLVADVSGHGMPAALIASMLKIAFAAQSAHASDPAAVITGLNKVLCGKFEGHFVTAAYALIDAKRRTVRYAGAGHPPLLLREAASGRTRTVTENGLFLGFLPRADYAASEMPFQEGDVVLLYTDGIPEATKGATEDQFGEDGLKGFLDACAEPSARGIADSLLAAVASWTGEKEPDDDTTLVVVRFSDWETAMTIARRLALLLAIPLLALVGLGAFVANQIVTIERLGRFVAEKQIGSLGALGDISRQFANDRICVRNYLLAQNQAERDRSAACLRENQAELSRLLTRYGDALISSDEDRRLYSDFLDLRRDWETQASALLSVSASGKRDEAANQVLAGRFAEIGERATTVLNHWADHNIKLSTAAANSTLTAISNSRRNMLIAIGTVMALSGTLGFFTFRRIVHPVRALQVSVERIASGEYSHSVPFTAATDETGALARSVDVLRKGAAAREQQRWVKASVAAITGAVQGAASHGDFGNRLLTELVPMLGGGVAGLYLAEGAQLERVACYGFADENGRARAIRIGDGLAGQCARDRRMIVLADLPPEYLRVSSGLGGAPPKQTTAWPLISSGTLQGVLEFAPFPCPRTHGRPSWRNCCPRYR